MSKYTVRTVKDLRDQIATLLAPELGTFSNGVAAIYVEEPVVPGNLSPTGLQCIIDRYSQPVTGSLYRWTVTLTQFDKSPAGMVKLDSAIAKLRYRFPRHWFGHSPPETDRYPNVEFWIYFPRVTIGDLAEC